MSRTSLIDPKIRDWTKVNNAIYTANNPKNRGRLIILDSCNHENRMKHHPDYDKPLEVELLCAKCHGKKHKEFRIRGIRLY